MDQVLQVLEYSKTRNLNRPNIIVKFHCFNISSMLQIPDEPPCHVSGALSE